MSIIQPSKLQDRPVKWPGFNNVLAGHNIQTGNCLWRTQAGNHTTYTCNWWLYHWAVRQLYLHRPTGQRTGPPSYKTWQPCMLIIYKCINLPCQIFIAYNRRDQSVIFRDDLTHSFLLCGIFLRRPFFLFLFILGLPACQPACLPFVQVPHLSSAECLTLSSPWLRKIPCFTPSSQIKLPHPSSIKPNERYQKNAIPSHQSLLQPADN